MILAAGVTSISIASSRSLSSWLMRPSCAMSPLSGWLTTLPILLSLLLSTFREDSRLIRLDNGLVVASILSAWEVAVRLEVPLVAVDDWLTFC